MIDVDDCGAIGGINEWQGKPKYSEETPSSAAAHHRSHMTWPGFELGKPATSRLIYGTAVFLFYDI
jgi:hypothetical protein